MIETATFRSLVAIGSLVVLDGCTQHRTYVPVTPESVENVVERGATEVQDERGKRHSVDEDTGFELGFPSLDGTTLGHSTVTSARGIGLLCHSIVSTDTATRCPYAPNGEARVRLVVDRSKPNWDTIGWVSLGAVALGGIIAAEAYCFDSACGDGGKVAVVAIDVLVVAGAALVYLAFDMGRRMEGPR